MVLNCGVGEDSWESLGLQGDPTSTSFRRSVLGGHWKHWCWGWNSNTLATSWEVLTHWKRPWFWEGLGAGGEGDNRGWCGWMASLTRCTWVLVNSGCWRWTGRPGVLRFMGSQRVGHDWAIELNWIGKKIKNRNIWSLNNMLLNNQEITKEIKRNQNMHRNEWKWKHDNPKPMAFSKISA